MPELDRYMRWRKNEMATGLATMNWREYVGRFSVEFDVTNHEDAVQARKGTLPPEKVRRARISGVVDTGAARLVLPESVVTALGLPEAGQITARFADGRRENKTIVGDVELEIQGRSSVFTAVVEPGAPTLSLGRSCSRSSTSYPTARGRPCCRAIPTA